MVTIDSKTDHLATIKDVLNIYYKGKLISHEEFKTAAKNAIKDGNYPKEYDEVVSEVIQCLMELKVDDAPLCEKLTSDLITFQMDGKLQGLHPHVKRAKNSSSSKGNKWGPAADNKWGPSTAKETAAPSKNVLPEPDSVLVKPKSVLPTPSSVLEMPPASEGVLPLPDTEISALDLVQEIMNATNETLEANAGGTKEKEDNAADGKEEEEDAKKRIPTPVPEPVKKPKFSIGGLRKFVEMTETVPEVENDKVQPVKKLEKASSSNNEGGKRVFVLAHGITETVCGAPVDSIICEIKGIVEEQIVTPLKEGVDQKIGFVIPFAPAQGDNPAVFMGHLLVSCSTEECGMRIREKILGYKQWPQPTDEQTQAANRNSVSQKMSCTVIWSSEELSHFESSLVSEAKAKAETLRDSFSEISFLAANTVSPKPEPEVPPASSSVTQEETAKRKAEADVDSLLAAAAQDALQTASDAKKRNEPTSTGKASRKQKNAAVHLDLYEGLDEVRGNAPTSSNVPLIVPTGTASYPSQGIMPSPISAGSSVLPPPKGLLGAAPSLYPPYPSSLQPSPGDQLRKRPRDWPMR